MIRVILPVLLLAGTACLRRELGGQSCVDVPGEVSDWLSPGGILIVGELHGTTEIPATIAKLACLSSRLNETVVALEAPLSEDGAVQRFLERGSEDELLASPFWRGDFQDGRTSTAMLELLRDIRRLRATGSTVRVAVFAPAGGSQQVREVAMARALTDIRNRQPKATLIVLVGRIHARKVVGAPWDADFRPMAWHLAQSLPIAQSVLATYAKGSAWVCCKPDHCAPHDYEGGVTDGVARFVKENPEVGFDGALFVGTIHPSPPAVDTTISQ